MTDLRDFLKQLAGARPQAVQAGVGVVVRELLERLEFVKTIDELLEWDPGQCKLSPGRRLLALVAAFVENRRALFRMPEVFATKDVEVLMGEGVEADWLNDKALGRALDKLYDADVKRVYSTICFRAVEAYQVIVDRLHADTTSVSVAGAYEDDVHTDVLDITRGYSKDHRPDLNQFKIGTVVTREGIPLIGDVFDGNGTDQIWNRDLLPWLSSWISEEKRKETLFVADSALIVKENLRRLDEHHYRFVSRLPNTFGETTVAKADALHGSEDRWVDVGAFSEKKDAAHYRLLERHDTIDGRPYRLIVIHSSKLSEKKAKTLERKAEKEHESLQKAVKVLSRETFRCREDALGAFEAFLAKEDPQFYEVTADVWEDTVQPKRPRRGRPSKEEAPPPEETVFSLEISIGKRNEKKLESERRWESTFVLITNDDSCTPKELFEAYRGQSSVEAAFRWLKAPVRVSPVFLKRPERVEAFGYVMLMAYLVAALVQKVVRDNLPKGEKLAVEGRKTDTPTAQNVLDMVAHAQVLIFRPPGERPQRLYVTTDPRVQRILDLLRIPADALLVVHPINSG